jgi:hypothetical protein
MTDAMRRSFFVGVTDELSDDEHRRLDAAGVRWKGSYDVLREGWQDETDTTPWTTRHVVSVEAGDADAAVKQVVDVLGRPASVDGT